MVYQFKKKYQGRWKAYGKGIGAFKIDTICENTLNLQWDNKVEIDDRTMHELFPFSRDRYIYTHYINNNRNRMEISLYYPFDNGSREGFEKAADEIYEKISEIFF